jgi:hypothetical protein
LSQQEIGVFIGAALPRTSLPGILPTVYGEWLISHWLSREPLTKSTGVAGTSRIREHLQTEQLKLSYNGTKLRRIIYRLGPVHTQVGA